MVSRNRFITALAIICVIAWILAAIHPVDRQAWVLENILVVLFVAVLLFTHRRLHLSNAAYLCLALFILLHIVGAHYTYAKMPLGLWAKDYFGFSRNHFDRVAHFGFGFFLAFPVWELLSRFGGARRIWSLVLTVAVILAVSGFFEILESIVAEIVAPGKGVNWLGGQGDEWDAQNDMISATLGAGLMMIVAALLKTFLPHLNPLPEGEEKNRQHHRASRNQFSSTGRNGCASASEGKNVRFIDNRFLQIAIACYAILWIALAIRPLDRSDWFLENLLVFATAAVLIPTYRKFQFSNASYAFILIFLAFHAIGAHYTYAKVPAGFWLQHWLHLSRNHYDRIIHFAFGFLLLYPMSELLARSARIRDRWAPWLAAAAIWALSSFFEIIEGIIAQVVAPNLGTAYLGTQGDIWDAQKDMAAAFVGALLVAIWLTIRGTRHP